MMNGVEGGTPKADRVLAVICQLWCWLGPLALVPLVLRLTAAGKRPFLFAVTGEVLNLQIVVLTAAALGVVAVLIGLTGVAVALWVGFAISALYGYVVGLVGAIRAWRGEIWRYPLNLNVIRVGAR